MMPRLLSRFRLAPAVLAAVCVAGAAAAQNTGVPNALQGFSQNRDKPIQIEALSLEVRDKDKIAVFTGNVVVTQGDTVMKCKSLHVFYDQEDAKGTPSKGTMKSAQPGPGGKQSIRRLEARGGVVVIQKEQTATGEMGIFEMKTNTVTLTGGVVIAQGTNILRGDRLVVDLTTSAARVESAPGKPVQGSFTTSGSKDSKDGKPGIGLGFPGKDTKADTKAEPKASAPKTRPAASGSAN